MPMRPSTPCKHPGCAALVPYGQSYCEKHKAQHTSERAGAAGRGYDARWRRESKRFLRAHPLCIRCFDEKKITKATVVDHVIPHRGDERLFWDQNNWQALCKHHHDVKTMTEDRYQVYKY